MYGAPVVYDLFLGNRAQQNRGKESAGLATFDGIEYHVHRGMGRAEVAFKDCDLTQFPGTAGISHVRYSTTGASTLANAHPIESVFNGEPFFIAHNGNLVNISELERICTDRGYSENNSKEFSPTDTSFIAALIASSSCNIFEDALVETLHLLKGTFSMVVLYRGTVYGIRDSSGNRPLTIAYGRGVVLFASESAIATTLNLRARYEVDPGGILAVSPSVYPDAPICRVVGKLPENKKALCVFEHIYFLRPDSMFDGMRAQLVREALGRELWEEYKNRVSADVVISVPDSGNAAAQGFSSASGIPRVDGLIRHHEAGRTFNDLYDRRELGLQIKFGIIPEHIVGKRIFVVDDSLVRATTIKKIIRLLKKAGAIETHVMISSPLYTDPCYYGIDTYRVKNELAARRHFGNTESICDEIDANSLYYLSVEGVNRALIKVSGLPNCHTKYCFACFTGKYPIPLITEKQ